MARVIFDNIGFSLQSYGGLSTVWSNLLRRFIKNASVEYNCIEYKDTIDNPMRKGIDIPQSRIIKRNVPIAIDRYRDLHNTGVSPLVFHSSHYRLCKGKNVANITTVHDFMYELFDNRKLAVAVHKWQKYRAIRKADVVVCISQSTKNDLLRFLPDVNPDKVKVIYNGVSDVYRQCDNTEPKYENYVLFVGGRKRYKNFNFLVDALKNTSFNLLICGKNLDEEERQYLNNVLGESRYKVEAYPDDERLNVIYNSVYCLAYVSLYEGFGVPVIEAQRAGCPVIACNRTSIPEIIGDTPLLLQDCSIEEFHEKLEILRSKKQRESIVCDGLKNADRFSWDGIAQEYITLYNELYNKLNK